MEDNNQAPAWEGLTQNPPIQPQTNVLEQAVSGQMQPTNEANPQNPPANPNPQSQPNPQPDQPTEPEKPAEPTPEEAETQRKDSHVKKLSELNLSKYTDEIKDLRKDFDIDPVSKRAEQNPDADLDKLEKDYSRDVDNREKDIQDIFDVKYQDEQDEHRINIEFPELDKKSATYNKDLAKSFEDFYEKSHRTPETITVKGRQLETSANSKYQFAKFILSTHKAGYEAGQQDGVAKGKQATQELQNKVSASQSVNTNATPPQQPEQNMAGQLLQEIASNF